MAGAACMLLASCQNSNPNIAGKWQASSIESPSQDSMVKEDMKSQLAMADTLSKLDSSLIKHFGSADLATVKEKWKAEINQTPQKYQDQMKKAAESFSFELLPDNKVISFNEGQADTAVFYFADNGKKIVFDPLETKKANNNPMAPPPQVMIFDIIHSGGDSLRLRLHQEVGNNVFINMHKSKGDAKKDDKASEKK